MSASGNRLRRFRGFSLIELIVGIVLMGMVIVPMTAIMFNNREIYADPIDYAKKNALIEDISAMILSRSFDDRSDFSDGWVRCGEFGDSSACPAGSELYCTAKLLGTGGSRECTKESGYGLDTGEFSSDFSKIADGEQYLSMLDDADDFITSRLCSVTGDCGGSDFLPAKYFGSKGSEERYEGMSVRIRVTPLALPGAPSGASAGELSGKLVSITVRSVSGDISYSLIRGNY